MKSYDVVIVGAEPAGLKAAEVLAKAGKKVVVLERNKIVGDKVCAGGITRKDFKYNIPKNLISRSFNKVYLSSQRQKVDLDEKEPFIYTIDRKILGKWQEKCSYDAGAEIIINTNVTEVKKSHVVTNLGKYKYKYLIGADGASSIVRRYLGIETDELLSAFHYKIPKSFKNLELYTDPSRFGFHYIWIFPHKSFTSIGTGIDVGKSISMEELKKEFNLWLKEKDISINGSKYEADAINYDYEGHEFDDIFLVGDAGGFTSGMTGEGIYSALLTGEEVAKKIIDKNYQMPILMKWLRCKKVHEEILRTLEIGEFAGEFLIELGCLFLKSEMFEDEFMRLARKFEFV